MQGMRLDSSNGQGSNREIFVSQATFDSNWRGLSVFDDSYVDITGIWAASSNHDQIWVSPESGNAMLALTGGTIFNGGSEGSSKFPRSFPFYGFPQSSSWLFFCLCLCTQAVIARQPSAMVWW